MQCSRLFFKVVEIGKFLTIDGFKTICKKKKIEKLGNNYNG